MGYPYFMGEIKIKKWERYPYLLMVPLKSKKWERYSYLFLRANRPFLSRLSLIFYANLRSFAPPHSNIVRAQPEDVSFFPGRFETADFPLKLEQVDFCSPKNPSMSKEIPSLKLTASLHLKMDGWNTIVSFWGV